MKKSKAIISLIVVLSLTGCNSENQTTELQKEYNKLKDEYDSVLSELKTTVSENDDLKKEIRSLNSEIEEYKKESSNQESETENENTSNSIIFNGMEITPKTESASLVLDEKEYSDHYQEKVIVYPLVIKNVGNETNSLNHYFAHYYGSQGKEMDMLYFDFDDGFDIYTSLRPGASIEGNFYMLYDGNGDYYIRFSDFSEVKEICVTVNVVL